MTRVAGRPGRGTEAVAPGRRQRPSGAVNCGSALTFSETRTQRAETGREARGRTGGEGLLCEIKELYVKYSNLFHFQ